MKLDYSIAVASVEQLAELPDLKAARFLEVPSWLHSRSDFLLPKAWKKRLHRVSCREETRTLSVLVDAGSSLSRDFFRMFSLCCADFSKLNAAEITLGIDWESVFADEVYAEKLRKILRCCFGITSQYALVPVLEVRIPGAAAVDPSGFVRFRDSLLFPVRTLIDLHPHEPGALEVFQSFSDTLHFDVSRVRVSFDAVGGNYLSAHLLEMIRSAVRSVGNERPEICFSPGKNADSAAFSALEAVMI